MNRKFKVKGASSGKMRLRKKVKQILKGQESE